MKDFARIVRASNGQQVIFYVEQGDFDNGPHTYRLIAVTPHVRENGDGLHFMTESVSREAAFASLENVGMDEADEAIERSQDDRCDSADIRYRAHLAKAFKKT